MNCDCTYCNAPCEKSCILSGNGFPVSIRQLMLKLKAGASVLPEYRISKADLSSDICGVKLENPFRLVCAGKAIKTAEKVIRR